MQKPSSAHEDSHRKGRPRVTSAAEDTFIRVPGLRNCSPNKCFRVRVRDISTSTVQRRLCEIRPSWSNCYKETTTKRTPIIRRDLLGPRNTSDGHKTNGNLSFGLMSPNVRFLIPFRSVFVRRRVGEWMISASVVLTVIHGGGVMMWGCFAGDTVCDLFRIQVTLNQHGYHSILQRYAIPSGLPLVGLSFG